MAKLDEMFRDWQELFKLIGGPRGETDFLLQSRQVLQDIGRFFEREGSADSASAVYFREWCAATWGAGTGTRLRAICENRGTKSLRALLDKVERHPDVFTRERYVRMIGESGAIERSTKEWDEHFGPGEQIDIDRVKADIGSIDHEAAEVLGWVDKRIAHLDPRWTEVRPTFEPLFRTLDLLRDLATKYYLLFNASRMPGDFGVLMDFDPKLVFRPGTPKGSLAGPPGPRL